MDEEACGSKSQFPYGSSVLRSCESSSSTLQRSEGATAGGGPGSQAQKLQESCIMGLETVIKDPLKSYSSKVQALLAAWSHVSIYLKIRRPNAEETTTSIIEWIHGHSLKLIFQGEWPKLCNAMRTHLTVTIQSCCSALGSNSCESKLKTLINLVRNPWGHAVLERLFQRSCGIISDEDVVAFCDEEKVATLAVRLETLCNVDCEDLALRLARICSRYVRLKGLHHSESAAAHVTYIIDVHIALLYKKKRTKHIMTQLQSIELAEGAKLVQRFIEVRASGTQLVWSDSLNVAELSAQYFLTTAMVKPYPEVEFILGIIMKQWTILHGDTVSPALPDMIRKQIQPARTAQHIYAFCRVLFKRFGAAMKTLCIEMYIQGLTSDMNELEQQKAKKDPAKVSEAEDRLSQGFLELSTLVEDNLGVCRECVLTAFSIYPTRSCYAKLKELAAAPPDTPPHVDTGQNRGIKTNLPKPGTKRCALHPPFDPNSGLPAGELCYTCGSFTGIEANPDGKKIRTLGALIKGDTMTKSRNYDVFAAPSIVLDAKSLGLSRQVLDDLTVVLSGPRYLPLSWAFDWGELSSTCEKYLANSDNRNKDTELKYLNIDYNQFKDWPRNSDATDDSSGIEKGYEDCIIWPEEEEEEEAKVKNTLPTKTYKRLVVVDVESDSSLDRKRRSRSLKAVRRLDIESDNDSSSGLKKQFTQSSSISGYDTCTQDSITDSLGSDGCRLDKPKGTTKKPIAKRVSKKKVKDAYPATLNEKLSRRDVSREVPGNKVMTIFKVDENGEKVGSTHGTRPNPANGKLLDKRVSDPNVVKSLRMFRHQNSKKTIQASIDNKSQPTYAPAMVSTLSLSPRIILQRAEDSSQQTSPKKPLTPNNLQIDPGLISRKCSSSKNPFQLTSKGGITYDEALGGVTQSALDCELIKAGIPGLNTLELLVPPISEATVQVVQLPRNPPAPSSGTNGASILRTQPPKATSTSQGTPSSGSGECTASSSAWNPSPAPQGAMSTPTETTQSIPSTTLSESRAEPVPARKVDSQPATTETETFRMAQTMTLASLLQSRPDIAQLAGTRETPRVVQVLNAVHASTLLEANLTANSLSEISRPIQTVLLGTQRRGFGEIETASRPETVAAPMRSEPNKESSSAGAASTSKVMTKTAAITAHIQKIGQPPVLETAAKPVNLSVTRADPSHYVRATATVTSGEVQMQPAQYVLMQTESGERAQTFPVATERQTEAPSPAEGLPKFHHAFSNKASRSIYCQTNPSEATQSTPVPEETEPTPAAQSSSFQAVSTTSPPQIPIATPAQPKPVQTTKTPINTGMLQTLLAAQPITRDNFLMTSRGPILRLFRTPSRNTPSMVYIGTANSKSPQITNANPSHVNPPSPSMKIVRLASQAGSSAQERPAVPTVPPPKETAAANRTKFHAGVATTSTATATQEPQICILDSSSDEEIDHVSHPVLQNTLVKAAETPTAGVIQLQNADIRRSRLTSFSAIQNYPATATKDPESEEVDRGTLNSAPVESASSSLEQQLLEFDVVLKQFTETSKMKEKGEIQPDGALQTATINTGSEFPVAHIPCLKVPTVSRMLPVKTPSKVTKVVMVSSNCQAVVSPSISISSSSSSPCVSTSSSAGKTSPSKSPKSSKSKSIKTSPSTSTSGGSKASPIPKPQQKPQEDEQTAQRIYAILDDYAEQIRNSPDLNNKPAPRRRSNPPTNPSQNSKRKKSSHSKVKLLGQQSSSTTTEMSPGLDVDDPSLLGSEDSCSNMMSMSQVQDSPAVSQAGDETTALDSSSEGGNLKSVVTESGEPPEQRHTLLCGLQGMLFKDSTPGVGDKSLLMSSTSMPIYMHGNVRQMLMQGLKGTKVIRVQQVSVPGTPGTSGIPAATTLLLRQMMQPSAATSVFGQQQQQAQPCKLPVGTISSQSLSGVSAQPPVVVPIGSHPLVATDNLLCADSAVTESSLVYHPRVSEPESVAASPAGVREEPSPRLLSVVTQSPVSLAAEPAPSLQTSPSNIRRCLALSFSSQSNVPVITNSHFQLTDNSECDMQVEVSERSGFGLGTESISMGGSILATNPEAMNEQDTSMDRLQTSRLMHVQTRNQTEPLFQTVNSSSATTTGMNEQIFSDDCGGLLGESCRSPAADTNDGPAVTESEQAKNKLPQQLAPSSQSSQDAVDEEPRFLKRKSDTETEQVYGKRKFTERWDEEGNVESTEGQVRELASGAGPGVVVCTETLEKTAEGKDQELELLAHDSWSDGGGSEDSTRLNQRPLKSLLKKRLLMKNLESGASKSVNLNTEQKLQTDSSENQSAFDDKSKQTKQPKRKGRRGPKKDTSSLEPTKRSQRLNMMQQSTLTDSTGTSEVDSSENLTSTFDRLHKQNSGQQRTDNNVEEQAGLSHLLVPYRNKSAAHGKAMNSGFCASRTEGMMMMGNEIIATAQLTDSTSEVEEAGVVRPQQFLSDNKLESEEKKVGRRSRHEGIRFTEVLLHKSLSEECEDLGVDRPSTSELFPEADLLLDTNSSPGFDATLQDASCSQSVVEPIFTEFPLPPTYYSSTSEEGNSNDSKPKTSARPIMEGQKIGTRSVRAVEKKSATIVAHKPVTRRATKTSRAKKTKPDVNGSPQSVEPVNGGGDPSSQPDPAKDTTGVDNTINGSSLSTIPENKILTTYKNTKVITESRPTGAKVAKCVTDNEFSNTDASPGDSMFSTESSSEDSNLARERYATNCVDSSEPTASSPMDYAPTPSPRDELPFRTRAPRRSYGAKRHRRPPSAEEFHNVDSGETWESTSSQDKAGADDEDSGSRSRTEMSSEMEHDQGSRHFSPESFTFTDRVNAQCKPGANGLGDTDDKLGPNKPTVKLNRMKSGQVKHVCKVEPSDLKRSSKRIKKIMSRRRCRSLEPQCVLLDVVDLTREGTKVRHLRHSSQRGHKKKPCSCCNGTEEQLKKKEELDKVAATAKKSNPGKQVVKGNNAKKR